jgi:hypothetical protein
MKTIGVLCGDPPLVRTVLSAVRAGEEYFKSFGITLFETANYSL